MHAAILAHAIAWRDPAQYRRLMRLLPNMSVLAPLVRDHGGGRVTARDGAALVDYRLEKNDLADIRRGIQAAVQIMEAGGAREIFTGQSAYVAYRPGQPGGVEAFMNEVDRAAYRSGQIAYFTFPPMGPCPLGNHPPPPRIVPA